ncbi:caspase family protein [Streptomyces sp. NPDC001414]
MTYLVDRRGPGPRVHALVIGVGSYRHLTGGAEAADYDVLVYGEPTTQLTSPPLSATAFARWVAGEMRHPVAHLGSVDVLISPCGLCGPEAVFECEVPSADAVVEAVDRWRRRCESDPGNVALFFFSGHGADNGRPLLLLEDFARHKNRLLDAAVDLEGLVTGMRSCDAAHQYYFIDACRNRSDRLAALHSAHTLPLLDITDGNEQRSDLAVIAASVPGWKAGGDQHEVSAYTQALLDALAGRAASLARGEWRVTSLDLYGTVHELTSVAPQPQRSGLYVHGNLPLHVFDGPPEVPLGVRCTPGAATARSGVCVSDSSGYELTFELQDAAWRSVAPAGIYSVSVDFPDRAYAQRPPVPLQHAFYPPDLECTVDVEHVS